MLGERHVSLPAVNWVSHTTNASIEKSLMTWSNDCCLLAECSPVTFKVAIRSVASFRVELSHLLLLPFLVLCTVLGLCVDCKLGAASAVRESLFLLRMKPSLSLSSSIELEREISWGVCVGTLLIRPVGHL